jgi:hypothetical protein
MDGDGRVEIVIASGTGKLYVFDDHGVIRPGFPVAVDPNLSSPAARAALPSSQLRSLNDQLPGFAGAPVLVDLDAPGTNPALEIVASALDAHVYAWRVNGTPVAGFPVRLRIDQGHDRPRHRDGDPLWRGVVRETRRKPLARRRRPRRGRPAEIVVDQRGYGNELGGWAIESPVFRQLAGLLEPRRRDLSSTPRATLRGEARQMPRWAVVPRRLAGRGTAAHAGRAADGRHRNTRRTGVPTSTAGNVRAIFGVIGPALLIKPDGTSSLGRHDTGVPAGRRRVFGIDFAGGGFPNVPATAGSPGAVLPGDRLRRLRRHHRRRPAQYVAPTGGLRKLARHRRPAGPAPRCGLVRRRQCLRQPPDRGVEPQIGAVLPPSKT